jgi:hypothetical protein
MSIIASLSLSIAAAVSPRAIVETAPLRTLLGQPSVRAEAPFLGKAAVAAGYDQLGTAGERRSGLGAEALFYPLGFASYPVFIGAGMRQEDVSVSRSRPRDTNSWARTNGDELYDRWTSHDHYVSTTQSVGYRLLRFNFATASFRLQRDEVLTRERRIQRDDIKSFDPDLSAPPTRKTVELSLLFHAGVYLP